MHMKREKDAPEENNKGEIIMATVTKIPATISRFTAAPIETGIKRKVAAYARVSTSHDDQLNSYEAQCDYYTNYIQRHTEWEFVGIYADEGISGTSTRHRDGFNQMVKDALDGKIGLILTKSVSRFARNTVDSLTTIRKLKENGTEVFFEKENIWTFDSKGELLITLMSSLAQEESRSISANVTWGQRKRFADGKATVPFSRFLGYDRGENGELVVNAEEAEIVKLIYAEFIKGYSYVAIAAKLTEMGIKSPSGNDTWCRDTVQSILSNEKYKGCALLQKRYTADFLTKKLVKNDGAVPQYYVEGSHEAIIDPEVFDRVQLIAEQRKKHRHYSGATIFSTKIRCGECGGQYGPKVWHSTDKYRTVIWQCNRKYKRDSGQCKCNTPHIKEEQLKERFVEALNKIASDRDGLISDLTEIRDMYSDVKPAQEKLRGLEEQLNRSTEAIQKLIAQNARTALDQDEYNSRYDELAAEYDITKAECDRLSAEIRQRKIRKREFDHFISQMESLPSVVGDFDETLWCGLVESATVHTDGRITFTLIGGNEVTV